MEFGFFLLPCDVSSHHVIYLYIHIFVLFIYLLYYTTVSVNTECNIWERPPGTVTEYLWIPRQKYRKYSIWESTAVSEYTRSMKPQTKYYDKKIYTLRTQAVWTMNSSGLFDINSRRPLRVAWRRWIGTMVYNKVLDHSWQASREKVQFQPQTIRSTHDTVPAILPQILYLWYFVWCFTKYSVITEFSQILVLTYFILGFIEHSASTLFPDTIFFLRFTQVFCTCHTFWDTLFTIFILVFHGVYSVPSILSKILYLQYFYLTFLKVFCNW